MGADLGRHLAEPVLHDRPVIMLAPSTFLLCALSLTPPLAAVQKAPALRAEHERAEDPPPATAAPALQVRFCTAA